MVDKVQKIAILGGSFDPVTNAHLEMVRKLAKRFSRVVVLPCYISPFKHDGCVVGGEDRVKMFRKVTADLENVKVSKWEIKREGISYSIDAVRHYREKYAGAELYFVIGSDCLAGLPEWKDADGLAASVTFYVFRRPGFPVRKNLVEQLTSMGFDIKLVGGKIGDESSGLVRAAVAFGKAETFVPHEVAEYIEKHELYTDYVRYTRMFGVFGLKAERIEHTFRAVKAGIWLAKIHGEDVDEVVKALILHDIGKYTSADTLKKFEVELTSAEKKSNDSVRHAYVSAAIARDYFKLNERIVGAIRKHTTGSTEMSVLDKIVYLADAVEEGRDYEGVSAIRRLAAKDLDKAMLRSLKGTIQSLRASCSEIEGETLDACRSFAAKCKQKNAAKKASPVFKADTAEEEKASAVSQTSNPEYADLKNAEPKVLARFIAECLVNKKGRKVTVIDVAQKTVVADCFVIAGAGSTTAVRAMADYVDERLSKDYGMEPLRRDISPKWAVLDYGSVIVHVQHEEAREFYRLEKLWDNGDNITEFH